MKHDHSMLVEREIPVRTESRFVRYIHHILTYWPDFLRLARSSQNATPRKETCMPDLPEIPNDDQVVSALAKLNGGRATALELCQALVAEGHPVLQSQLAIQRAADRGRIEINRDWSLTIARESVAA